MLPVYEILALGISPLHGGGPSEREWVVLVEHVPDAVNVYKPIWVVMPTYWRGKMELGPKAFGGRVRLEAPLLCGARAD